MTPGRTLGRGWPRVGQPWSKVNGNVCCSPSIHFVREWLSLSRFRSLFASPFIAWIPSYLGFFLVSSSLLPVALCPVCQTHSTDSPVPFSRDATTIKEMILMTEKKKKKESVIWMYVSVGVDVCIKRVWIERMLEHWRWILHEIFSNLLFLLSFGTLYLFIYLYLYIFFSFFYDYKREN